MQAGESLSFITVPDELAIPEAIDDAEREDTLYAFYVSVRNILQGTAPSIRTLERPEESGVVIVKEGSYQVPFNDGSYLHIVAYGHEYNGDYLDLGLSIREHNESGVGVNGFLYELAGRELKYAAYYSPQLSNEDLVQSPSDSHFSLIDEYELKDQLYDTLLTGDEQDRIEAQQMMEEWKEKVDLTLIEKDLGFSWHDARYEDIQKIYTLLQFARPFTVPDRSE